MSPKRIKFYEFANFRLDLSQKFLLRGGKTVPLTPKVFDTLKFLIENAGQLLEKEELMRKIWQDHFVEESNLTSNIKMLRKALGDDAAHPRFIETVPRRGYRFIAEVSPVEADSSEISDFRIEQVSALKARSAASDDFAENPSIAVLPFVNMSSDADTEYFCDGLTEEILNALAKIENLKVAARTSAFSFKNKNIEISEISRILRVGAVLEGSVRKSGERLRITVQLINAANGFHLWSERYDHEFADIFDVQDRITLSVVEALKVNLLGDKKSVVLKRYTDNTEAYEAYLKGRFFWNKRTAEGFQKGIEYFEQAISIDQNYAIAYAGLADCYNILGYYEMLSPREVRQKSGALLRKALELDDALGETYASLGVYRALYEWDWKGSENAFAQALRLYPNFATALVWSSVTASANGRFEEAVEKANRARELDPLSPIVNAFAGWMYYYARHFEEAEKMAVKTIEIAPNHFLGHWLLGVVHRYAGRYEQAIIELRQTPLFEAELGHVYAQAGRFEEAEIILNKLTEKSKQQYVSPVALAAVYAGRGETEKMFASLKKALGEGSTRLQWFVADPLNVETFGSDERFWNIRREMRFVPGRGYRFNAEDEETFQTNDSNEDAGRAFPEQAEKSISYSSVFKKFLLPALVFSVFGLIFIGFWYARSESFEPDAPILSAPFSSEKLSTNGKVFRTVISPDGKNVIYTNGAPNEKQSVWLRQLDSGNNVEIIPPSDGNYFGLALSPDGNFLFFARSRKDNEKPLDLYRVSIFGGIPTKIADETEGWISLSPDGARISFVRCPFRDDEFCSLWIADATDGKNEKKLAARPRPVRIGDNEISPDGRSIVFAAGQSQTQANEFGLMEIEIENGEERELTPEKFFDIKHLTWLPDKSGLLFTASRIPNKNFRIWLFARGGEVRPLTKDSENYSRLSLDREARLLTSTQTRQDFHLFLRSVENPVNGRVLADAVNIAFAPNGKIIFTSTMTGNDEIWSVSADGSSRRQLTNDAADDRTPVVSPDNNWVFFTSNRTGAAQIWRMNADGSNQTQITNKEGGFSLFVSPDGEWLYYRHGLQRTLWRVSTSGGTEQFVLNKIINCDECFAFSPDGSQFAELDRQGQEKMISIFSLSDGQKTRSFQLADEKGTGLYLEWSKDGKNLIYVSADTPYENNTVWLQPLDEGKPRKIAVLGDEFVNSFALAPDGKSFAVVQGGWKHDAVLLKGLK